MPRYSEEIIEDLEHMIDGFRTDFQYIGDLAEEILASARAIKSGSFFKLNLEDVLDKAETIRCLCDRNKGD